LQLLLLLLLLLLLRHVTVKSGANAGLLVLQHNLLPQFFLTALISAKRD
jgi:hypothetical protein